MIMSMILIEVASRQDAAGKWIPLHFRWRDVIYEIKNIGRRWQDERGEHMLVMTYGDEVYELLHQLDGNSWFIKPRLNPKSV